MRIQLLEQSQQVILWVETVLRNCNATDSDTVRVCQATPARECELTVADFRRKGLRKNETEVIDTQNSWRYSGWSSFWKPVKPESESTADPNPGPKV